MIIGTQRQPSQSYGVTFGEVCGGFRRSQPAVQTLLQLARLTHGAGFGWRPWRNQLKSETLALLSKTSETNDLTYVGAVQPELHGNSEY
jgi:hypothetical protein